MKKVFIYFVFFGMMSCGFSELDVTSDGELRIDSNSVSMTDALAIASSFMTDKGITPATRAEELSVRTAFSINDKANEPLFHVVNYDGGGFVIVAGDIRLKPIQAYSPTGCFDAHKEAYPIGLKIWLDCVESSRDNALKENGEEPEEETRLAWIQYGLNGFDSGKSNTRSLDPIIGPPHEEVDTLVGPFFSDTWYQGTPYNDSLQVCGHYYYYTNNQQIDSVYKGQFRSVLGCVPLAIAKVLRYNHIPNNYSWSSMLNHAPQTAETVSFVRDVHYAVKTYANSHGYSFRYKWNPIYDNNGNTIGSYLSTGVSDSLQIGDFLCDEYGFPAAITETYTSASRGKIRREIFDYHLPCILCGSSSSGGHAWVCDGYNYHSLPVFDFDGEFQGAIQTEYLHHCWGVENGSYDGWFSYNDYAGYQNNMKLTHRISTVDYWQDDF